MKIYTVGYAHWTAAALAAKVAELDAILVDIRFSAYSQRGEFHGDSLSRRLTVRYFHMKAWGNVNYNRSGIHIADFKGGLASMQRHLSRRTQTLILMCAVADSLTCHRVTPAWREVNPLSQQELAFGDFSPGRVAWELHGVRALREPVLCRVAAGAGQTLA